MASLPPRRFLCAPKYEETCYQCRTCIPESMLRELLTVISSPILDPDNPKVTLAPPHILSESQRERLRSCQKVTDAENLLCEILGPNSIEWSDIVAQKYKQANLSEHLYRCFRPILPTTVSILDTDQIQKSLQVCGFDGVYSR